MVDPRNISYDDNPDFNDELDQQYPVFRSASGTELTLSWMLFNTDEELYLQELDSFKEQKLQALLQNVQDNFPPLIAYNLRLSERGEGAEDPVRKLLHLKDTWEGVIYVLYALVFGEFRKKGFSCNGLSYIQGENADGEPLTAGLNRRALLSDALKVKLEVIRAVVNWSRDNGKDLKCEQISDALIDDLKKLQDVRNSISHHTAPTVEQAREELSVVTPIFEEMLEKLVFLENCRILRFKELQERCRCEVFAGHFLNKEFEQLDATDEVLRDVIPLGTEQIFVEWEDEYFSLSPFLHYMNDATGHESYLCFFKRKKESKFWYEPIKMREDQSYDALQARFNAEIESLS